jgi:ABC-type antimicrobial peptide transport system permease subunit
VSNLDPASYLTALGTLALIALLSMLVPAARTLRLNVASILHHE